MLLPKGASPKAETARQALLLACQLFGVNAGEVERATCVWRRLLSCQTQSRILLTFRKRSVEHR